MFAIENYYETASLHESLKLLASNPQLKIIAGGTDVLVKLQHQHQSISLLSIRNITSLEGIVKQDDGSIEIGPLTTFTQISRSPLIQEILPSLAEAAVSMGGPQIRNIATIGGNLCNGATSADSASTLFALNARLGLQTLKGTREISIQDFYLGPGKVDLKPGELLTSIRIRTEDYSGFGGHYIKFAMRKAMDIATLGVSVLCKLRDERTFEEIRIGLGVAGPTPLRCEMAEEYAVGKEVSLSTLAKIGKLTVNSAKARTSWRASKEYREHLVKELTQRALVVAIERAGGGDIA